MIRFSCPYQWFEDVYIHFCYCSKKTKIGGKHLLQCWRSSVIVGRVHLFYLHISFGRNYIYITKKFLVLDNGKNGLIGGKLLLRFGWFLLFLHTLSYSALEYCSHFRFMTCFLRFELPQIVPFYFATIFVMKTANTRRFEWKKTFFDII
jgi:hypothetical protein